MNSFNKLKKENLLGVCVALLVVSIMLVSCNGTNNVNATINNTSGEMLESATWVEAKESTKQENKEDKEYTSDDLLVLDTSERKVFNDSHIFKDKSEYPRVDGSTALMPLMAEFRKDILDITKEEAENDTACSKTAKAWYNLSSGIRDLLIVGEMPETTKSSLLSAMNTKMKNSKKIYKMQYAPIRREGLVFIVNKDNPVESLTKEQLIDIYTGKITNWKEVGGNDVEIAAFQRNEDSGSQTIFRKVLMKGIEPIKKEMYYYTGEMDSLIDVLSTYDNTANAIGYSVFYYVTEMYKNDNLKLIKVDGVEASKETIGDNTYPLLNESYVAIRCDEPEDSNTRKLYDYIRSEKGKDSVRSAGYVPVK